MTARGLRAFGGGLAPRIDKRLLRDDQAQIATDVVITSGALQPLKKPSALYTSLKSGNLASAHRLTATNGSDVWLAWTEDVDAVRALLPNDSSQRVYYTGAGEPRVTDLTKATALSDNKYPDTCFVLGVVKPDTDPTLGTISGGSGATETRVYTYTFVAKTTLADGSVMEEEGQPADPVTGTGKVDDTWTVNVAQTSLNNSNTVSSTSHSSGITTVNGPANSTLYLRANEYVTISSARYRITEVTSTTAFKVSDSANAFPGSGTWSREAPHNTTGMVKRIYRSNGGDYFKVADVALATTSYNDSTLEAALPGPTLESAEYELPPADLHSLIALPNGPLAGISGNALCYSEPYQPHAWPSSYRKYANYAGVSLGSLGTTVVMTTEGSHYLATGTDPSAVSFEKAITDYPCVSKRGTVSLPVGVAWPTHEGLAVQTASGAYVITKDLYTRREWKEIVPSSMFAAVYDGRYVGSYLRTGSAVREIIILDPSDQSALFSASIQASGLYADRRSGKLYVLQAAGISEWDAGLRAQMDWQAKEFVEPRPINWAAAKVDVSFTQSESEVAALLAAYEAVADANEALSATAHGWKGGEIGAHAISSLAICEIPLTDLPPLVYEECGFYLYIDGEVKHYQRVTQERAFRLPVGYKSDNWSVRIIGNVTVRGLVIATSMSELSKA